MSGCSWTRSDSPCCGSNDLGLVLIGLGEAGWWIPSGLEIFVLLGELGGSCGFVDPCWLLRLIWVLLGFLVGCGGGEEDDQADPWPAAEEAREGRR